MKGAATHELAVEVVGPSEVVFEALVFFGEVHIGFLTQETIQDRSGIFLNSEDLGPRGRISCHYRRPYPFPLQEW